MFGWWAAGDGRCGAADAAVKAQRATAEEEVTGRT